MRSNLIDVISDYPYRANLEFCFSDSFLTELVAENVNLPRVAAIDIFGMDKYLQIRVYLGINRKISIKEDITLEYDGFRYSDLSALLVFKMGGLSLYKRQSRFS